MNKLITIDDSALDQVSGGGVIASTAGAAVEVATGVVNTAIGTAGRIEDSINGILGGLFGRVGRIAGAAVSGVKGVIGAAIG
jgi:hypothetical protein